MMGILVGRIALGIRCGGNIMGDAIRIREILTRFEGGGSDNLGEYVTDGPWP
jgi:hypothetical protein